MKANRDPGGPCVDCDGANKIECVAVKAHVDPDGTIVAPGDYAVCSGCHAKQYKDVYGFTPDEAPFMVKPRE